MPPILHEALEWLDRAEQAREVAGLLTDPSARKAVLEVAGLLTDPSARKAVLELAESFDRLARAAANPAVLCRRELAMRHQERS
jgi:hypothetical protein